jgi:Ca2+-dependent lipid-binding protein
VLKQKTRAKITRPAKKLFQLRAHLYVARDLPAGDEDALSDPYCLVNISHAKGKSKIREHTIFPDWFESVVLDVELPEQLNLAPDIYLSVYDHDMLTPDEFLGCVVVNLATSDVSTSKNINAPKWFPLVLGDKVKV